MSRRTRFQTAKVFHISLDEPLLPLEVEHAYREVLLVVTKNGHAIGQLILPALERITVDMQRRAIAAQLGSALWRRHIEATATRAFGPHHRPTGSPTVTVVVCTRDRTDDLRVCIDSLLRLTTPAHEILVVDNAPSDDSTRALCAGYPVRYVLEELPGQSRARNRGILEASGELVAFTDDDVAVDSHWLDELETELADRLTMAVTGYVGPLELETRAQYLFETHGGFRRGLERRVFDGVQVDPATWAGSVGAGANSIFRRDVFEEIGLFAEDLGPGTPARAADDNDIYYRILAAGFRIVFDPRRVVWHSHRRDDRGLRQVLYDYTASSTAFATRRLLRERDLGALRIWSWWWLHHFPADVGAIVKRRRGRLPVRMLLAEMRGTFTGPWHLWRSWRSRRDIPPLELPARARESRPVPVAVGGGDLSFSIVVPSHNRRDLLRGVLEGIAAQTYPLERLECVVVLDGATDGSAEMVRALDLPLVRRVVEKEKSGIGAVRNAGVSAATHPIILFIDDDIVPGPGCVAAHARAHAGAGPSFVSLGYCPPVIDGSWWSLAIRAWWEDHYRRKAEPGHEWSYVDFTTGNASLALSLLLDAGGFDESFHSRHEDWELAIRLLGRGGLDFGFSREAEAQHHLDTSFAVAVRHQRQEARDDVILARKHPQVMGQLPLASYIAGQPAVAEKRLQRLAPLADRLERLGLRRSWSRVTRRALRDAYVLGIRDAVPNAEDFFALVAPVWMDSVQKVPVDLGEVGRPVIPPVGSIELAVSIHGTPLGRVVAVDPGGQWDWLEVSRRIATAVSGGAQLAEVQEQLAPSGATSSRRLMRVRERGG